MPTGGEAHHADFVWINLPFGGAGAQSTQRSLSVGERRIGSFGVAVSGHTIGHDEQGVAFGVKRRG